MRRVNWRVIAVVIVMLLALSFATGVVVWTRTARGPSEAALNAIRSDEQVKVLEEAGWLTFGWSGVDSSTGLIFYPGAGVDYRSYSPVLRQIAAHGYFVVLAPMPLNLAFFNANAADQVAAGYPDIEHWAIGGHSLGGVAAASYAGNHPAIERMVFWASYPADDSLKDKAVKILSTYGFSDGLCTPAKMEESRAAPGQYRVYRNHGRRPWTVWFPWTASR